MLVDKGVDWLCFRFPFGQVAAHVYIHKLLWLVVVATMLRFASSPLPEHHSRYSLMIISCTSSSSTSFRADNYSM